ncbi:MAG: hypothetical protein HY543_03700, partial [Deltaproteobacteria bacterium]|nr:hypothetical protein [Deltaproteobacteria bacterium]
KNYLTARRLEIEAARILAERMAADGRIEAEVLPRTMARLALSLRKAAVRRELAEECPTLDEIRIAWAVEEAAGRLHVQQAPQLLLESARRICRRLTA